MKSDEENKNIRKFSWKEKKRFSDYESALLFKNNLLEEGYENVKIKRCGPGGTAFKVVTGTSIKNNKTNKKGKNNAN